MDKNLVRKIKRFRQALEAQGVNIRQLVLFGSCAVDKQHEGSDIDMAVISDSFKNKNYWNRIDVLSKAIFSILEPIEAVGYTTTEWDKNQTLMSQYAHQGKIVWSAVK